MKSSKNGAKISPYKIIAVASDSKYINSLSAFLKQSGYQVTGVTDPDKALEILNKEHFDLMILDFAITPIHGDKIVEKIREFNSELYIILLTEHEDFVPPLETLRKLSIQGYCEKSDKFDQLLLLIESGLRSIEQMHIIQNINSELKEKTDELEKAIIETVETLRYTVEVKDTYTRGHSDRVADFAVLIGKYMGLSKKDLNTLHIGGLFHDIGKIGVPDTILLKEEKLTDEEYSQIKNHPSIGKHILSNATVFQDIIPIVYSHHEKYDGTGYPKQLAGDDIPLLARITAVADTFDAMTTKRSYRNALPLDVVRKEIKECSGTQFDPKVANVFLDILDNHYNEVLKIQNKY